MNKWLVLGLLLAIACQQTSANTCNFYVDSFFGYSCELHNANVTGENEVLNINTTNHLAGRSDNDVTHLEVANSSSLVFFPNSLLQQFPNIRYLFLDYTGLRNLTPAAFVGCANLVILHARFNFLQSIPAGVFTDCGNLRILELSRNQISEIHDDAFVDLENLLELDMNFNQLTTISARVFRNQVNLEEFNIRHNQISVIEDGAFSTLSGLITFYLRNNFLTEIRPEMFGDEISLVFFNLNNNRLTSVPRLPARAPRIKYIHLLNNLIAEINEDDFTFAYSNITNIDLTGNLLTSISSVPFEGLSRLDILILNENLIEAVDHELFDRIPSLYTFYLLDNVCANIRFDNIRSINQDREIERALDRCYYHFFEPVLEANCNYVEDPQFGYTCELSGLTFMNFRDKFSINGEHMGQRSNEDVTGLRITNSNLLRVPPTLFRTFPNVENLAIMNSGIRHIDVNTFEECGLVKHLDLSRNSIRRLHTRSFDGCYYVEELILDDNQISEIKPCDFFLLNIYQTRILSMRNNICVDRSFQNPTGEWLINDQQNLVNRFLNRCFSLWYMLQDNPDLPPEVRPPPPPEGETTTATPVGGC